MTIEEQIARIIDPAGWAISPSAYGLQTEEEMLRRTWVGAVRSVAISKAREIIELIRADQQFQKTEG